MRRPLRLVASSQPKLHQRRQQQQQQQPMKQRLQVRPLRARLTGIEMLFQHGRMDMIQAVAGAFMAILLACVSFGACAPASTQFSATAQQLRQLGPEPPSLPVASARSLTGPYHYVDPADYDSLDDVDTGPLMANVTLDEGNLEAAAAAMASERYIQEAVPENGQNVGSVGGHLTATATLNNMTSNILFATSGGGSGAGSRKSHIIRWPNAQSSTVQSCDDGSGELECEDENAVCKLGGCVCKMGFFLHRQSSLCQSISDLLKNCENDYQCQAFNVDMICDTKSHERPFCDCTEGLYYDQETHTCLPCLRASMLPGPVVTAAPTTTTTTTTTPTMANTNSSSSSLSFSPTMNKTNHDQTQVAGSKISINISSSSGSGSSSKTDELAVDNNTSEANANTRGNIVRFPANQLRLCKPSDFVRVGTRRRLPNSNTAGMSPYDRQLYDQTLRGPSMPPISNTPSTIASSSDPFRIRTPLEVFMGAIMLFTLFTVAWFFLQRMIHDCRAILRSLRNPDFSGGAGGGGHVGGSGASCTDQSFISGGGPFNNFASARSAGAANHHYFDPTGQAVARLFSGDGLNGSPFTGLTSSIYQRDLAGVMVQHLAANLSPSSTSQALAGGGSARGALGLGNNEHDAALYPLTASAHQTRTAAAAAAAQLLLSPTHPAIAILRAAAAAQNPGADYTSTNFLNSMFDPPPKYEEAIAQFDYHMTNQQQQQQPQSQVTEPPPAQLVPDQSTVATAPPPPPGDDELGSQVGRTAHGEVPSQEEARSPDQRNVGAALSIYIPPGLDNELVASSDNLLRVADNGMDTTNQIAFNSASGATQGQEQAGRDEIADLQRRESLNERRSSRRSRRGRGSVSRFQHKTQDSD